MPCGAGTYFNTTICSCLAGNAPAPPICYLGIDFDNATNLNGLYITKVNITEGKFNLTGNSAYFNGLNSYIEIPLFNNNPLSKFTICLWARRNATGSSTLQGLVYNGDCATQNASIEIRSESTTTTGAGAITDYTNDRWVFTNFTVPFNTWNHECLVYNGQTLLFYVNNELKSSAPAAGSTIANKCPMKLGLAYYPGVAPVFFSGFMDEIWFCSDALNGTQINKLYYHQLV